MPRTVTADVRGRLEELGVGALSNPELFELLGVRSEAVPTPFELSRCGFSELAARVGATQAGVLQAAIEIGRRCLRATDARPRITSAQEAYAILEPCLAGRGRERFHVLCLSGRNVLLANVLIGEGGRGSVAVDPREVFRAAIKAGASSIIVAHGHPSGSPEPSGEDIAMTNQLATAGGMLALPVLDHIIVGDRRFVSMAERGLAGLGLRPALRAAE